MKSRGYKFTILAACLFASSAYATCKPTDPCGGGQPPTPTPTPPASQSSATNNVGIGVKASAAATALSKQNVSVKNHISNSAKGGSAKAYGGNATGGNAKQGQGQKQSQNLRNAGNSNVVVEGSSYVESRRPVNTAYAAGLVASPGTCLGSASGGVQGSAIGLSFGSTTRDDGCHLIRRMVVLDQLGMSDAALSLACLEDDNIREAMTRVGRSCTTGRVSATWNVHSVNPIVPVAPVAYYAPRQDRN